MKASEIDSEGQVEDIGVDARDHVDDWFLTPAFAAKVAAAERWDDLGNSGG